MADKTEKKPGFVARMKAAVKGFAATVSCKVLPRHEERAEKGRVAV